MVPPSELASMSGVSVLTTDSDCTSSDGSTSSATARRLLSGEGTRVPLMVTLFRSGAMPRTLTKRPSPWSRSTEIPGMRCSASAALSSGNWPMPSAWTTLLTLSELRWSFSASSMLTAWPMTSTCSMTSGSSAQAEPALTARASRLMRNPAWRMPLRYVFMNDSPEWCLPGPSRNCSGR